MTLLDEAERAEKIRNAFTIFTGPVAGDLDAIQDINKAISELSSLSYELRHIDRLIPLDDGLGLEMIEENLKYIHENVTWTLSDVWQCIGRMGRTLNVEDYQNTWQEIVLTAKALSGGKKLDKVLEGYRRFLESLSRTLESHVTSPTAERLGPWIMDVHKRRSPQPQLPPSRSRTPTMSRPRTPNISRSNSRNKFARPEAIGRRPSTRKAMPKSPEMRQPKSYERERPMSPDGSSTSSATDTTKYRDRVFGQSPPLSPSGTISSISQVSSNTPSLETHSNHWARRVFRDVSSTPLPWSTEETRYHEVQGTKEHSYPNQTYDSVLNLAYPEGVRVSLFCRSTDYRAKVVVHYRDRRGNSEYGCLPLSELHLRREGSVLRICRRRSTGKTVNWVSMKFTTIERLILFADTFIAMRAQDGSNSGPPHPVLDVELGDENLEFSSPIADSGFSHALRVYHDEITQSIRLEASVLGGDMDRTPVWTAFITHVIASPGWCRQSDRRTINLAELKLHIFSARYKPILAPSGAFKLQFGKPEDARAFLEVIDSLRSPEF